MKIAVDYREVTRENKAGKGVVVFEVVEKWKELAKEYEIYLISDDEFNFEGFPSNFHKIVYKYPSWLWHFRVMWDVWFCFNRYVALTSYLVPWLSFSNKCIIMVHDLVVFHEEYSRKHNSKAKIFEKISFKGAVNNSRAVIVPSKSTKDDLLKLIKINEKKIHLVYEGVNKVDKELVMDKVLAKFDIRDDYIFFVGTLEPRKNLEKLILAYHQLKLDIGWNGKLVLAGKKGWYYKGLFDLVDEYGIEDDVIFTGYIDDNEKFTLLNGASCFYFVSKYEGFGLPILEAMQMSVPVITSNVSSMPEVAGKAAVMIDPNSVEQIKGGLREILTNKEFANDLRTKGLKRIEKFDWKQASREILSIVVK